MGDRAIITTRSAVENGGSAVYLHWNGSLVHIRAYTEYCALQGFRTPDEDPLYGFARLTQVIANTFENGLSVGVGQYKEMEHMADWDNGVYVLDGWDVVSQNLRGEVCPVEWDSTSFAHLQSINLRQPGCIQFNTETLMRKHDEFNDQHRRVRE